MSAKIADAWDNDGKKPKKPPPPAPPAGGGSPWADPPFVCLGQSGKRLWFIDFKGEVVDLAANALQNYSELLKLCGGRREWLQRHFPAFDREGLPIDWFNTRHAVAAIIGRSCELDLFDAGAPRRRYGLWVVAGGHALHTGGTVLWLRDGKRVEQLAGFRDEDGALWPRLPRRPLPPDWEAIASAETGRALEAKIATWNWENPHGAALMLGAAVVGMLGAAAPWRAHLVVVGEPGCGKSTLLGILIAGLCPLTRYQNDYTEPGLRQLLTETAAGVILDEAEGDGGGESRLTRVIEMLRKTSSGSGVQSVKGGADHAAKTFTVTTSAILGCVLPPALTPQDETRMTTLLLRPLAQSTESDETMRQFVREHGPALWGRTIANVGRIGALFTLLRRRLIDRGYSARVADQLGMLAAARWAMVADPDADPRGVHPDDDIDVPLQPVEALMAGDAERVVDSGPNQCLQRLLASPLDMQGDKATFGQGLYLARKAAADLRRLTKISVRSMTEDAEFDEAKTTWNKYSKLLEAHGLKWATSPLSVEPGAPAPPVGLYVAVSHPKLTRAFQDTAWGGGRWGTALSRLPAAKNSRDAGTVRVGGGKPRCVWVPGSTLAELTE